MRRLDGHPAVTHPDLVVGIDTADDAGVVSLGNGRGLVQTVDFFTPVVDDPHDWGRVAAANALSDVYAMGATPVSALQLVSWPRETISFDVLGSVVEGGAEVMAAAGCTIVGGHSIDDQEPKYGFAVSGLVDLANLVTNRAARPGDRLVLTKPLGSGIVTTAIKRGKADDALAEATVAMMVQLNDGAARAMVEAGVKAATDVTGYGLLGHLGEVVRSSLVHAVVSAAAVPILNGVRELAAAGVYPGGSERNLASVATFTDLRAVDQIDRMILADAQTSGGLLICAPEDSLQQLLVRLQAEGVVGAAVIGELVAGPPSITVRP